MVEKLADTSHYRVVAEGSESDGNGHYEHAPVIVRRHGTEAERASSSTRRPGSSIRAADAARSCSNILLLT